MEGSDGGALHTDSAGSDPSSGDGFDTDRDPATGRFVTGNRASLVVGQHSARFWSAADEARREIAAAVIADAGHTIDDAPRALRIAADQLAMSTLVRDSAFDRLVQDGGALTGSGRVRRALAVWAQACERVDRCLRLVGLRRAARDFELSPSEWLQQSDQTDQTDDGGGRDDLQLSDPEVRRAE